MSNQTDRDAPESAGDAKPAAGDAAPRPVPTGDTGPIRRVNIAVNVAVQILCAVVLFFLINYLSSRHYTRTDLSAAKKYSVSEDTANFLSRLGDKVNITMAYLHNGQSRDQLAAMLTEYERLAGGQIALEQIDPARDKERALEVAERYGMPIDRSCVFIEIGGRVRRLTEADLHVAGGAYFAGEDALTSALFAATEDRPKTLYLVAGKGRLRDVEGRSALDEMLDLSRRQFFTLKELTFGNITAVPDDADGLLLINPEADFSADEMAMFRDYWENRHGSLVALLNPSAELPNLYGFLREHGVTVRNDLRLLFAEATGIGGVQKRFAVQAQMLEGSPVTTGSVGNVTTLAGQSCPLVIAEEDEGLAKRGVTPTALMQVDPRFWGDANYREAVPTPGPGDLEPPLHVAASIERGGGGDEIARLESSRLVAVGNATLLDPDHISAPNAGFVMDAVNWSLGREERLGFDAKPALVFRIDTDDTISRRVFFFTVVLLPALAFCFAVFVWSSRRS